MAHPDRGEEIKKNLASMLEELRNRRQNNENAAPPSLITSASSKEPSSHVTSRRRVPSEAEGPSKPVDPGTDSQTPRISPHVTVRRRNATESSQRPATTASSSARDVSKSAKAVATRPTTSAVPMETPVLRERPPKVPAPQKKVVTEATPVPSEHPIRRTQSAAARPPSAEKAIKPRTPVKSTARSHSAHRNASRPKHESVIYQVRDLSVKTLDVIGTGGSCTVYSALCDSDRVTGLVAVKVVELSKFDESSQKSFINEIELLESLQGNDHVIKMHAHEIRNNRLFVVLEHGDSDFQQYIKKAEINPHMIKFYWKEMLECVKVIHDKNIVHSDLKPANFLLVKGFLKLIDFGIATHIDNEYTCAYKDNQSGTVNFMSPEMLTPQASGSAQVKIPLVADVWSLGCILYHLVYGKLPYQYVHNVWAKIEAIKTTPTEFGAIADPQLLDVLKRCFVKDYRRRATVDELLAHPYLTSEPGRHSTSMASTFDTSTTTDEDLMRAIAEINANKTPRSAAKSIVKMIRGEGDGSALSFDSL
uniref:Protein kinase domain-containing protein n=1 Tax=Panagrellus redivivus TaxID=6233 RepID=A0A7E4VTD6_PANRE